MSLKGIAGGVLSSKLALKTMRTVINRFGSSRASFILNFHRFYESSDDLLLKGPSVHTYVDDFEKMLTLLGERFDFISISQIVEHLNSGEPFDSESVAITMDDGYLDNLTLGLPVLARLGVPATLYVATRFIDNEDVLPMDAVEYALRTTSKQQLVWKGVLDSPVMLRSYAERREANILIGKILKDLRTDEMSGRFEELYDLLDIEKTQHSRVMLTWDQVKKLSEQGVDIGSHGISHKLMTVIPEEEAKRELYLSQEIITEKLGVKPVHFAFPNGREQDFNNELRAEAKRLGYSSVASVTRQAIIPGLTDPYNLPRLGMVGKPRESMLYIERLLARTKSRYRHEF